MVRCAPNRLCAEARLAFLPARRLNKEDLMATAPAKSPAPATVTLKHLAANIAENHELSKKQAEEVLGDLVGNIVKHLKKGERIRIGRLWHLYGRKPSPTVC